MMPHMHLRGKDFVYTAFYPTGESEVLLRVPKYDFSWQLFYYLADQKVLPAGTRLHCVAHFDNSPNNPANPDATKAVRWGDQSWEEMMIGWFDVAMAPDKNPMDLFKEKKHRRAATSPEDWKACGPVSSQPAPSKKPWGRPPGLRRVSRPAAVMEHFPAAVLVSQRHAGPAGRPLLYNSKRCESESYTAAASSCWRF